MHGAANKRQAPQVQISIRMMGVYERQRGRRLWRILLDKERYLGAAAALRARHSIHSMTSIMVEDSLSCMSILDPH